MTVIYLDQYRPRRILVAASEKPFAETLCEFLLVNELRVELVDGLDKVMPALEGQRVDMVLLTGFGPRAHGIPSVVQTLRERYRTLPIVVLSSFDHIRVDALKYGADLFMTAPFCFMDLLGRIRTLFTVSYEA